MARKAPPFALCEKDVPILMHIASNAPPDQAKVADILLACANDTPIKDVAKLTNVDEKTVRHWRNQYLEHGLSEVIKKQAGRQIDSELEKQVLTLLEATRNELCWTVESLADYLDVSEKKIRTIIKLHGITLERSKQYQIRTSHELSGNGHYLCATYLGAKTQMMVFASYMPCLDKELADVDCDGVENQDALVDLAKQTAGEILGESGKAATAEADPLSQQIKSSNQAVQASSPASETQKDSSIKMVSTSESVAPAATLSVQLDDGLRDEMDKGFAKKLPLCLAEGSTAIGHVLTVDRGLKKAMEKSVCRLSMEDVLYSAMRLEKHQGNRNGLTPNEFFRSTVALWMSTKDVHLDVFYCGALPPSYRGPAWTYTTLHHVTDLSEWRSKIMDFMWDQRTEKYASSHGMLVNALKYIENMAPEEPPFCWQMLPNQSGIQEEEMEEWRNTVLALEDDEEVYDTLEQAVDRIKQDLKEYEGGNAATPVKALLVAPGEDGHTKYMVVSPPNGFPPVSLFDLSTWDSFDNSINELDKAARAFARRIDIAGRRFYLDQVKKKPLGALIPIEVEFCVTRMTVLIPLTLLDSVPCNGRRYLSAEYRRSICTLSTKDSYRDAHDTFNNERGRTEAGDLIPLRTFIEDVIGEGLRLVIAKNRTAKAVLLKFHLEDLLLRALNKEEIPEEYRNSKPEWCETQNKEADSLIKEIDPQWDPDSPNFQLPQEPDPVKRAFTKDDIPEEDLNKAMEKDLGVSPKEYAQPDTTERVRKNKKRKRHELVLEAEMQRIVDGYMAWFNENADCDLTKILSGWKVEKRVGDVLYISIDAVYVLKQDENHVAGGKTYKKEEKPKISHWNIHVEIGEHAYIITDTCLSHAMMQLVAFIMENGLYNRYFIFFTDGETAIFDMIKRYFSGWEYAIYLDLFHATHKLYEVLSMAIKSVRVVDPQGDHKYYERGPKTGEIRKAVMTSLSRLYARRAASILYVGNIPGLISYLENIDPAVIANKEALEKLIAYFEGKGIYATCYALRRRLGLRNSSNQVELSNNRNTSVRQKHRHMTWNVVGSGAVVSLKTLELNGESDKWYRTSTFTFRQPYIDQPPKYKPTVTKVYQFEKITKEDMEQFGPKNNPRPKKKAS